MSKRVYVSIKGKSTVDGESDTTELMTEGLYTQKGEKYLLRYNESFDECGRFDCSTLIKLDRNMMTMTRSGASNTQMIFETGKRHVSHYETPVGSFTIGVMTDSININVNEDGGDINVKYLVDINQGAMVENTLRLNIRNANFGA